MTRTDIVYLIGKRLPPTEFDLADAWAFCSRLASNVQSENNWRALVDERDHLYSAVGSSNDYKIRSSVIALECCVFFGLGGILAIGMMSYSECAMGFVPCKLSLSAFSRICFWFSLSWNRNRELARRPRPLVKMPSPSWAIYLDVTPKSKKIAQRWWPDPSFSGDSPILLYYSSFDYTLHINNGCSCSADWCLESFFTYNQYQCFKPHFE